MTGPDSGGTERGTGAPARATGTQGAGRAILGVLALGLALRLIIAYLIPGSGFDADLSSFRFWASNLASEGLYGFYERDFFHDYTPGYLYVLWLVGTVGQAIGGIGDLIKVPPVLADLALGFLVWSMVRELGGRERLALLGALVVVLNPITWFDSVVWGQVDAVGVVFLLLALRAMWRDQPERAAILTVIAAVIKPQLGILVPLLAVVTIRRALWPVALPDGTRPASGTPFGTGVRGRGWLDRLRGMERRTGHPVRILTTGVAGYLTALALCLPFGLSVLELTSQAPFLSSGLIDQIVVAGGGYPYLTVNAYNAWAIVPGDMGHSLANAGVWVCDAVMADPTRCGSGTAMFGAIPPVVVGAVLLLLTIALTLWVVARHPDRPTLTVGLAILALAFFAVPTRVHERYGFPFFAVGAILVAVSARWRLPYLVLSIATFANMYVVLTTLYPPADPAVNPVTDWLGIGPLLHSDAGVTLAAVAHTGGFLWALVQLRRDARERSHVDITEAAPLPGVTEPRPTALERAPGTVTGLDEDETPKTAPVDWRPQHLRPTARAAPAPSPVALPSWRPRRSFGDAGFVGWLRDRIQDPPMRADRSRLLLGERGGRFDRLDVWILVVLLLTTLGLRTFRLAEPYQMHFDEVYHARTATEFLQGWRYGESHDIYEWTHPHLAKYAMALGLLAWGEDDVSATSALGTSVQAVAHEPRREDPLLGERAGERMHVATPEGIRSYDLVTRQLVSRVAAPGATALANDPGTSQLFVGREDGTISTLDLTALGLAGVDGGLEALPFAAVDHPVEHLLVSEDGGTILAASDTTVTTLSPEDGSVVGTAELPAIAGLAGGGSGPALIATPAAIEDPASIAATLAELLDMDAADIEAQLAADAGPDGTVILGSPGTGEDRTAVDAAIEDGRLAGVEIVDVSRIAVATGDGVAFIDPGSGEVSSEIALPGGAHGLDLIEGLDDPKLYVTSGSPDEPVYTVIAVGGDAAADGPVSMGTHPLPAPGTRVAYNAATQQIHVLGRVPGSAGAAGDGWTVYVIEPRGGANAVFADARLPDGLEPAGWVMDAEPEYVSEDRQQLLVVGEDGTTASVEVGSHAFAWRLPGVIAGVLMGLCLYVLARILFQRRLVAVLVGGFVVLDGMLFVQSRIGMNDAYVGLFIVAAYTLFAAIWTGWWRSRWAPWVGMPLVGSLLGLALSSKWVAAYAIGALALLLLVRSALGRVAAILGLIALTSVLGYMAISVPEGQGFGNVTFLALMIALTLIAVVVAVQHPIAWTDAEQWFALAAPAVLGAVVFFAALATGRLQTEIALGSVVITPLLAAIALASGSLVVAAAFTLGGRLGYGPLAGAPAPDDPRSILEPPAPPPPDWLRPGWLLGLPLVWAVLSLVAIPLTVYVVSYIPWASIENHRLWEGFPAGNTGQTLLELTAQMYGYHDGLAEPHAASSPWWAWPLDLKPVWFYQDSFAGGTTAAVYDAGNLVIWWFGIVAIAFVALMAYRRRSLALALIAIGFAAQWVSWARIDRAAFQYHYYTALPFVILALGYFVAELWHGASRRTWLVARMAGAAAILLPAALWILSRPLCWFVGVERVNPDSAACPAVIPDLVITVRTLGLLAVVAIGVVVLVRAIIVLGRTTDTGAGEEGGAAAAGPGTARELLRPVLLPIVGVAIGFALVALLPDAEVLRFDGIPVEPIAIIVAIPLAWFAAQVAAARDAHRFVVGLIVAAGAWFVVVYPNIAALPLPSAVANAYQGILPTYLYAFQFPVTEGERDVATPLTSPVLGALGLALLVTVVVVAYSASSWRLALAESRATDGDDDGLAGSGGLTRTGEGA